MDQNFYTYSLNYARRFGVEIEINSFDSRNRPVHCQEGNLPDGIYYVGNLVQRFTDDHVVVQKWGLNHFNSAWIIKPDSSCGLEVCSPVLKGWAGLKNLCCVLKGFENDPNIASDSRCSLHVHVDVSDLSGLELASVLSWWIKFEAVFLDSVPSSRKLNQYCQFFGLKTTLKHDAIFQPEFLVKIFGQHKYHTINTYHYLCRNRKTIEFRIMDHMCCRDPWMAKNWVRLILHFVECCVKRGLPVAPRADDPWSGYTWLDPADLFDFLGFFHSDISPGLEQVRGWFLSRLKKNVKSDHETGVFSAKARRFSIKQIKELDKIFITKIYDGDYEIFSDNFRI